MSPYSLQFTSDWGYPPKEVSEGVRRERPASAPKMDEVVCAHKKKFPRKGAKPILHATIIVNQPPGVNKLCV